MKRSWGLSLLIASLLSLSAGLQASAQTFGGISSGVNAAQARPDGPQKISAASEQEYEKALALRGDDHLAEG